MSLSKIGENLDGTFIEDISMSKGSRWQTSKSLLQRRMKYLQNKQELNSIIEAKLHKPKLSNLNSGGTNTTPCSGQVSLKDLGMKKRKSRSMTQSRVETDNLDSHHNT